MNISANWQSLESLESALDSEIESHQQSQIATRRHLRAHPEPRFAEFATTQYIRQQLADLGLHPVVYQDGLGVSCDYTIGQVKPDDPLIAIRCDIDALRMPDEKQVPYASQYSGVCHACGHDAHTAILLGIAYSAVSLNKHAVQGQFDARARIRLIFQPAEEISKGAEWLVQQGVLEGVYAILGLHVDPTIPVGEMGIRYGTLTANCDEVRIIVKGRGGHAARPHHTRDPISSAAHLVSSFYKFLPRSVDSRMPAVFTIGQIQGGYAPNVIPEKVELGGSLRTLDQPTRTTIKNRIAEICLGVGSMSGTEIHVQYQHPLASVVNDPKITADVEKAATRVVGPENTHRIDQASLGGEDFSVYLEHVPGCMIRAGCGYPDQQEHFLHSTLFDIDEKVLALGTRILSRAALLITQSHTRKD